MKGIPDFILKISVLLITLSSVPTSAIASDNVSKSERLRIDFLAVPDWIEIVHVEKIPEELEIRLVPESGSTIPIATFGQDGPAFPELASIFKNKVRGKQVLFAIIKWRYYLSGVDTEGDYYEVHAYEAKKKINGKYIFFENKRISNFYGSGFDGKQEGKTVSFKFKNSTEIRKSLSRSQENTNEE